jgi:aryl carrier-like protein
MLDGLYKYTDNLLHNGMDSIKLNTTNKHKDARDEVGVELKAKKT